MASADSISIREPTPSVPVASEEDISLTARMTTSRVTGMKLKFIHGVCIGIRVLGTVFTDTIAFDELVN